VAERSEHLSDPEGTATHRRTGRGGDGEISQSTSDARYDQVQDATANGDPDGVGDTARGWFRRSRN
jgi:hypothetical protein